MSIYLYFFSFSELLNKIRAFGVSGEYLGNNGFSFLSTIGVVDEDFIVGGLKAVFLNNPGFEIVGGAVSANCKQ